MARLDEDVDAHAVRLLLLTPVAGLRRRTGSDDENDDDGGAAPAPFISPESAALAVMAERRKDETDRPGRAAADKQDEA
jgi:hypothetical protein